MSKDRITCHILDTAEGRPAVGVRVRLELTNPATPPVDPLTANDDVPHGHRYAGQATTVFESQTNDDGRVAVWLPYSASNASGDVPVYTLDDVLGKAEAEMAATADKDKDTKDPVPPTTWTLRFDTDGYYGAGKCFFPEVAVTFRVGSGQHYHVPLLLSPFTYTTYRGS